MLNGQLPAMMSGVGLLQGDFERTVTINSLIRWRGFE